MGSSTWGYKRRLERRERNEIAGSMLGEEEEEGTIRKRGMRMGRREGKIL